MKIFQRIIAFPMLFFVLSSCQSTNSIRKNSLIDWDAPYQRDPFSVTATDGMDFIAAFLEEFYLWNDQISVPEDIRLFSNEEELFYEIIIPQDRFSFIDGEYEMDRMLNQGIEVGFGFHCFFNYRKELRISQVHPTLQVLESGITRGAQIISINGKEPWDWYNTSPNSFIKQFSGDFCDLQIILIDGSIIDYTFTRQDVELSSIQAINLWDLEDQRRVGYFAYTLFSTPTEKDILNLFEYFMHEEIDELIIDLRENPGGDLNLAMKMVGIIGGSEENQGEIISVIQYNEDNQDYNSQWNFSSRIRDYFPLDRVLFLTSSNTASSAESLINSLDVYVDCILIGGYTHGKPYGMHLIEYNGGVIAPVMFRCVNALGEGHYENGLMPDQLIYDAIDHDFGCLDDPIIQETLYYLNSGDFHDLSHPNSIHFVGEPRIWIEE